jgi:Na+/melibiose symporter-like transporter
MPGVITSDPKERHALQSWRFFLAAAGSLAISGIALPLVNIIGKGNEQVGILARCACWVFAVLSCCLSASLPPKNVIPSTFSRALPLRKT